jgi:hypothetical protein
MVDPSGLPLAFDYLLGVDRVDIAERTFCDAAI